MAAPKLFISYSWSDSKHEQWVVDLATELRESGVDVILDKWDLREGHDAVAFMEKMVTDPEIKKVAIICDQKYASKADGRAGGVGTETQIISKKVYDNQAQEKFVAVVCEKDDNGKPFLPTYYQSRIYIDLSEEDRFAGNFEQLLRWVYDKPIFVKPELGRKPAFLDDGEHISLGTTAIFKRCVDALKHNKPNAAGAFDEYCNVFTSNLERFRLKSQGDGFDEQVIKNIEEFLPFRSEVIQLFVVVAQYSPHEEIVQRLHRFLEGLIPYMIRPESISSYRDWDFDNFKFIVHELFLYALAVLLKHDRFEQANYLLQQPYYLAKNTDSRQGGMVGFDVFWEHMLSLESRNRRLGLRRLSLRGDLLKERSSGIGIDFRYLQQADFVVFMRTAVDGSDMYNGWWPDTLVYQHHGAFEIFARAVSKAYFEKVKVLLAIATRKDLESFFESYETRNRRLPSWDYRTINPAALLGYEQLATRP